MISTRSWIYAVFPVIVVGVLLIVAPLRLPGFRAPVFVAVMICMLAELNIIGLLVNGRFAGAFIDNRNRISLSKLQAAAWTAVVLSAFATAAAYNIAAAMYADTSITALAVTIPNELLLAMGISATSLVATPALLTLKSQQATSVLPPAGSGMVPNGKLAERTATQDATWADIVTGDEVGNAESPDLGKIQAAFITLILLGCYIAYVYADLAGSAETIHTLPTLDQSFVWLLGISHASYLAYKAAPHTT